MVNQFEFRSSRYETASATKGETALLPFGNPIGVVRTARGEVLDE